MTIPLTVDHVSKTYPGSWFGNRADVAALIDVSVAVRPGEVFGLLGPNGSGKTTLAKIALGLVRANKGTAHLDGLDPRNPASRARVGVLPEHPRIPPHLTGAQAMDLFGALSRIPRQERRRRIGRLLERMGIQDRADHRVSGYSKGMVQRLALGAAMISEPRILVLDEPTDGLDPLGRAMVADLLSEWREQGRTVLLNSHLLGEVERVCDRVAILHLGRCLRTGTVDELTPATRRFTVTVRGEITEAAQEGIRSLVETVESVEENRITVLLHDHSDTDRLLDLLRAAGVGVASLIPHRITLEGAFLETLKQDSEDSS